MAGEVADVQPVDDRLRERRAWWLIVFPVVRGGIRQDALQCGGSIVAWRARSRAARAGWLRYTLAVGIQQHLCCVEEQPLLRRVRPVRSISVELTRPEVRHEGVPVVVGSSVRIEVDDPRRTLGVGPIEQQQLYRVRMLGK